MALRDTVLREELRTAIVNYFALNTGSVSTQSALWEAFKACIRGVCMSTQTAVLRDLKRSLARLEEELAKLGRENMARQPRDNTPYINHRTELLAEYTEATNSHACTAAPATL